MDDIKSSRTRTYTVLSGLSFMLFYPRPPLRCDLGCNIKALQAMISKRILLSYSLSPNGVFIVASATRVNMDESILLTLRTVRLMYPLHSIHDQQFYKPS
jgi:hypothetical protein